MSTKPTGGPDAAPATESSERRRNAALRTLIDEMLMQVRGFQREGEAWGPEERAQAEAALARIMGQVRDATVARDSTTGKSS